MPDVITKCFHTRDAVERDEGSFTFEMPLGRLREEAGKVYLASCEFPMVQYTVEQDWDRLWYCEGIRLDDATNYVDVAVHHLGSEETLERLRLPPRVNRVVSAARSGGALRVRCEHAHGLAQFSGEVHLLGDAKGTLSGAPRVVDETTFELPSAAGGAGAHTCYVPAFATPADVCAHLTRAARPTAASAIRFAYDAEADRVRATITLPRPGARVRILPTPLARLLGVSTASASMGDAHTFEWPSEPTAFWSYVQIPAGFYSPCHRPMSVAQPLRIVNEVELAANRFYLPLVQEAPHVHLLVFSDPSGNVLTCQLTSGRYTCETLATALEEGMTEAAQRFDKAVQFAVSCTNGRFTFACERDTAAGARECAFGLLLNHPLCVDASRLGFAAQPLTGSTAYTSSFDVAARGAAPMRNVLRMSEVGTQKRFRVNAVAPPAMMGVCVGPGRYKTYVNGVPFAHGYRVGDVVRLSPHDADDAKEGDGGETSVRETRAALPVDCDCAVVRDADPLVLEIAVPRLDGINDEGSSVQIHCLPEPWSLHFGKPKSLPRHLLGAHQNALLWGVDGSVEDARGRLLPPFELRHVHMLDHPDYVLMTFSESSSGTFEHSFAGETKAVFCKLSLYPLFREERMLPRDTTLLRGQTSRFTLSFWNPDFKTPYHFHGAEFSFSLSFVSGSG